MDINYRQGPRREGLRGSRPRPSECCLVLRTDIAARKLEPNSPRTGPTLGRVYLGLLSVCQDWDSAEHEVADLTWRTGVEAELKVLRDAHPRPLGRGFSARLDSGQLRPRFSTGRVWDLKSPPRSHAGDVRPRMKDFLTGGV